MARQKAHVNPDILVWAREDLGLDIVEAAHRAGIRKDFLTACEAGHDKLTIPQLRRLATIYKRPLAVFYLSLRPTSFQVVRDFRRLPGATSNEASPRLRLEYRRAHERRLVAIELAGEVERPLRRLTLRASLAEPPQTVAKRIRDALKLDPNQQSTWRNAHRAFSEWRRRIEELDVLVFQATTIETAIARGFSIAEDLLPVVVVNRKDAWAARTFTLLHELTHILLRSGGVCDLHESPRSSTKEARIEAYCNAVSGSALVPADQLLRHPIAVAQNRAETWGESDISELASHFACSRETIVRRLLDLNKVSKDFYETKRKEYDDSWHQLVSRRTDDQKEMKRNIPQETISAIGGPFIRLALDTYHQQRITLNDLSDILGVQTRHVARIQQGLAFSPR